MHLSIEPPSKQNTKELYESPWVAFDTEFDGPTTLPNPSKKPGKSNRQGPDQLNARLVGFSLWAPCLCERWPQGVYFPLPYSGLALWFPGPNSGNWAWLREFLEDYSGRIYMHNALADLAVLTNPKNMFPYPRNAWDTMVMAWALGKRAPGSKKGLSLDACIRRDLGVEGGKSFQEEFGGRSASEVPAEEMAPYAARDAWYVARLVGEYTIELAGRPKLERYVTEVEMPLLRTVLQMYQCGVGMDLGAVRTASEAVTRTKQGIHAEFKELTQTWVEMPAKAREPTGEYYKNGNPKLQTVETTQPRLAGADVGNDHHVARWLYDELAWWPRNEAPTTDTGRPSVAAQDVTRWTKLSNPLAARAATLRLQYQKLDKLQGTYLNTFPFYARKHSTGRVHASMRQTGTETSRFSSSHPNMQNLPRSQEEYLGLQLPNVRAMIRAPEGRLLVGADYGQLELRLMAHLSRDENLIRAFVEALDPHQMTIDKVREKYGITIDRNLAKITNFSTIYRIGAWSLSQKLGVSQVQAQQMIDAFYAQYPSVAEYQRRAVAYARRHNAITTLGGFVRRLNYPTQRCQSTKTYCRCAVCKKTSAEDNKAINTPVQGSAGVLMKKAMVALEKRWRDTSNLILMQVHDELLCEVDDDDDTIDDAMDDLKDCMEGAMQLRVPLVAEPSYGRTWSELK